MIAREEARLRALFARLARHAALASTGAIACACSSQEDGAPFVDASMTETSDASAQTNDATLVADAFSDDASTAPSDACDDRLVEIDAPNDGSADGAGCDYFQRLGCGLPTNIREGLDASRSGCALYLGICYSWCSKYGSGVNGCSVVECDDAGDVAEGPVTIDCVSGVPACTGTIGRRPRGLCAPRSRTPRRGRDAQAPGDLVGAWLADCARLEAASVRAFHDLRAELASLGAPRSLVQGAARAARDEARHARIVSRLARLRGAKPARAVVTRSTLPRSLAAFARDNAIEGCVREAFGALVATLQATHARDATIASAMARIAEDETRHAALAWAIARWLGATLDGDARHALRSAMRGALDALRCEVRATPAALARELGLPFGVEGAALVDSFASALLDDRERRRGSV